MLLHKYQSLRVFNDLMFILVALLRISALSANNRGCDLRPRYIYINIIKFIDFARMDSDMTRLEDRSLMNLLSEPLN